MTSMLEKAANRLRDTLDGSGVELTTDICRVAVRAVLHAVRDPDVAMRKVCRFETAEVEWPAMIDAILRERRDPPMCKPAATAEGSDRAKLEEAIELVDLAVAHLKAMRWDAAIQAIRRADWPTVREAASSHLATLPEEPAVWAIVSFDGEPNIASGSRLLTKRDAEARLKRLREGFPLKVFVLVDLSA